MQRRSPKADEVTAIDADHSPTTDMFGPTVEGLLLAERQTHTAYVGALSNLTAAAAVA